MNFTLKGEAADSEARINFEILDLQSAVLSSLPEDQQLIQSGPRFQSWLPWRYEVKWTRSGKCQI